MRIVISEEKREFMGYVATLTRVYDSEWKPSVPSKEQLEHRRKVNEMLKNVKLPPRDRRRHRKKKAN
jgi:hypothetical protein